MPDHPVQTLRAALEAARKHIIEQLAAAPDPLAAEQLRLLATIQTALSAVREAIEAHGVGWGGES